MTENYTVFDEISGEVERWGTFTDGYPPEVAAGKVMVVGDFRPHTHYLINGAVTEYTAEQSVARSKRPTASSRWDVASMSWVTPEVPVDQSITESFARGEVAAQEYLDSVAKSWGYDDLRSAASYATSKVPRFASEAAALVSWRDDVWVACYELQLQVQAGTVQPPTTPETFLALLPSPPVRPVK